MSERSGGRERSEQSGASERVSGASERANGRARDPVLQSAFLVILSHCAEWRALFSHLFRHREGRDAGSDALATSSFLRLLSRRKFLSGHSGGHVVRCHRLRRVLVGNTLDMHDRNDDD